MKLSLSINPEEFKDRVSEDDYHKSLLFDLKEADKRPGKIVNILEDFINDNDDDYYIYNEETRKKKYNKTRKLLNQLKKFEKEFPDLANKEVRYPVLKNNKCEIISIEPEKNPNK